MKNVAYLLYSVFIFMCVVASTPIALLLVLIPRSDIHVRDIVFVWGMCFDDVLLSFGDVLDDRRDR